MSACSVVEIAKSWASIELKRGKWLPCHGIWRSSVFIFARNFRENCDHPTIARFFEKTSNPQGLDLEVQPLRHYPHSTTAAHVLGFLVRDNRSSSDELAFFNYRLPDFRGRVGIEGLFDDHLRGKAGVKSVLVNSLGETPPEELDILYRYVRKQRDKLNVDVLMPLVGRYATSMEMAGVSFTICRLDGELESYLKAPAGCAFWRV